MRSHLRSVADKIKDLICGEEDEDTMKKDLRVRGFREICLSAWEGSGSYTVWIETDFKSNDDDGSAP